jgi:hypothetical protein
MTAASTIAPARHEPELLGQTVVVIGGSAGIGMGHDREGPPRMKEQSETSARGRAPEYS